jgi:hypothetical protein
MHAACEEGSELQKGGHLMSNEENKAIARRWSEELWSKGDLAIADEIVAPNYVRPSGQAS